MSVIPKVDAHVHENSQFAVGELHEVFSYISRSFLYKVVTAQLCVCQVGEEVKETVTDRLRGRAANFYDKGIVKPVQHLEMIQNDWTTGWMSKDSGFDALQARVFLCSTNHPPPPSAKVKNDVVITPRSMSSWHNN
jgi:hypothetical protein